MVLHHSRYRRSWSPDAYSIVVCDSWAIAEYLDQIYPNENIIYPPGTKPFQALFVDHSTKHIIFDNILPTWSINFLF
jgi:hypothetical protein